MKISNIKYFSTINGDGFRTAVFVSGCNLHCKGCFNSKAWDFNYGIEFNDEVTKRILDSIDDDYIDGLSILGGEPMDAKNQDGVFALIEAFRKRFGIKKDIWMWTGYKFENIPETKYKYDIIRNINYMIDGPYDEDQYDVKLRYRGSHNQRVIDIQKSLTNGEFKELVTIE